MIGAAAAPRVAATQAPVALRLGAYRATISASSEIRHAALSLRAHAFRKGADDTDRFDANSLHGLVEDALGQPRVAFRVRLIPKAADLDRSYTGQFYDLDTLSAQSGPFLELGRVCQSDGQTDVMALRLAWAALSVMVDQNGVRMMFGCSSLAGADPEKHGAALAYLRAHHIGPRDLRPRRLSRDAVDLPDGQDNPCQLPHLLRSYLGLGGWISDHAIRDPQLDTLHVFTALDIDAIPAPRKTRLRALARAAGA
ncbi:GNAT family N-acyltransferase [uncultured Marivita sp.]|uniref:GNAT family N-acyltransferase n=1 Tax=uncultured Marivita sp. TaxID=888080 RepID=UPI002637C807|nr:GNAT family N-acyltransferase [uncultured Marivita sp.]